MTEMMFFEMRVRWCWSDLGGNSNDRERQLSVKCNLNGNVNDTADY